MDKKISIGRTLVGPDYPPYLIAEIGLNHNGSMMLAKEHIQSAAKAGANLVKFQKRDLTELALDDFLDSPFKKCPSLGRTQREVREILELTKEQIIELREISFQHSLDFSFSVFDLKSLEFALEMDLNVIKIPSHSATNFPLIKALTQTDKPIILSMGGTTWEEKEQIISLLGDTDVVLMHCISSYPTKDEELKLDTIKELDNKFNRVVGYSGHEPGYEISASSVLFGASVIERHFTLSRSMVGLDHKISLEPNEFSNLTMLANRFFKSKGILSDRIENGEIDSRNNYHVSICSTKNISKGHIIKKEDICCKQPLTDEKLFFTGLEYDTIINAEVTEDILINTQIPRKSIKLQENQF